MWTLDSSEPAELLRDEEVYDTQDLADEQQRQQGRSKVGEFVPFSTQPFMLEPEEYADGSCVSELDEDGATAALARSRLRARLAAGSRVFVAERFGDRLGGSCFSMAALESDSDDERSDEDEDTVCCPSCGNEFAHVHKHRPRSKATLVERYNRLQFEAARLEADLREAVAAQQHQQAQHAVGADDEDVLTLPQLADKVAALSGRLRTLPTTVGQSAVSAAASAVGRSGGSSPAVEVVAPRASRAVVGESDVGSDRGDDEGAEGHSSNSVALRTLADLDRRLAVLEKTVGCADVEAALGAAPLCKTVAEWRKRLVVLTAAQLDALKGKIKDAQDAMATLRFATTEHAPSTPQAAAAGATEAGQEATVMEGEEDEGGLTVHEMAQVQRVLENMERWERTRVALPEIVERLRTLAPLHEAAASFVERLDDVESRQAATQRVMDDLELVVVRLEQSLSLTSKRLDDNFRALEARLPNPH